MRITYYPETDSLSIDFRTDYQGPGHGEDVTPDGSVTAHYSADEELVSVEIEANASRVIDLSRLDLEGLPGFASMSLESKPESKTG